MKRYVLLKDKRIVDTSKNDKYKIHEDTLWHNSMVQEVILKQSDNLLDLREPMDILIVQFNDGFFNVERPIYATKLEDYHKVIALIKNQGDIMRRYEVKTK